MEADVEIPPGQTDQQLLQPSKPANSNRPSQHRDNTQTRSTAQTLNPRHVRVSVSILPAGVVKGVFDDLKAVRALQPGLDLRSMAGRGQPHHGSSRHAVGQDTTVGSASQL